MDDLQRARTIEKEEEEEEEEVETISPGCQAGREVES